MMDGWVIYDVLEKCARLARGNAAASDNNEKTRKKQRRVYIYIYIYIYILKYFLIFTIPLDVNYDLVKMDLRDEIKCIVYRFV